MAIMRSTLENVLVGVLLVILMLFAIFMIAAVVFVFWYGIPAA
jgi:hypothetical protein